VEQGLDWSGGEANGEVGSTHPLFRGGCRLPLNVAQERFAFFFPESEFADLSRSESNVPSAPREATTGYLPSLSIQLDRRECIDSPFDLSSLLAFGLRTYISSQLSTALGTRHERLALGSLCGPQADQDHELAQITSSRPIRSRPALFEGVRSGCHAHADTVKGARKFRLCVVAADGTFSSAPTSNDGAVEGEYQVTIAWRSRRRPTCAGAVRHGGQIGPERDDSPRCKRAEFGLKK